MPDFKLVSDFKPTGDQPEAIRQLVAGLQQGYHHQTLLGATGTGKSLDGAEPMCWEEKVDGRWLPRIGPIGQFVEEQLAACVNVIELDDTQIAFFHNGEPHFRALSFNPHTAAVQAQAVTAAIRHRAPRVMYRVTTACGRSTLLTGDHNLWVLRDGSLLLLPTTEIAAGDCVPLPSAIPGPQDDLLTLDLMSLLGEEHLFVAANEVMAEAAAKAGRQMLMEGLRAHYKDPTRKVRGILRHAPDSRVPIGVVNEFLDVTNQLDGAWDGRRARIAGRLDRCALPAELAVSDSLLRLIGYYIAEGNSQSEYGYFVWASRRDVMRKDFEDSLTLLGIAFTTRPSSDYQVSSTPLALLLKHLGGSVARDKHLPDFWPQLSDRQLGQLLRAYFDGDGTVERWSAVTCVTASRQLASDLCYALQRFGIWARIRTVWKRAVNSAHEGGWYWSVSVSGQDNLRAFARSVGFSVESKAEALTAQCLRNGNSNVDTVPGCGSHFRHLREYIGASNNEVARVTGLSRGAILFFEQGKRNPTRMAAARVLEGLKAIAERDARCDPDWWREWRAVRALCELHWTPLQHVERVEYDKPYVYDISVAENETFLAGFGGMFVHNTYVMAAVVEAVNRPTLIMAHNKTLAAQLYSEFKEFFPHNAVEYFVSYYDYYQPEAYLPRTDTYIEKDSQINEEIDRLRLAATSALLSRRDVLIVASVSCIYGLGDPAEYGRVTVKLKRGERVRRDLVLRELVEIFYERNDLELRRGKFRVRGDTLEVMPAYADLAYRIEFFGDDIDRITEMDPLTGQVLRRPDEIEIFPAKHFITPQDKLTEAIGILEQELTDQLKVFRDAGKLLEAQRLEQRTRYDIEMLREVGYCSGIENYSRALALRPPGSRPFTLLDYFPTDWLLIVDESHMTLPQVHGMFNGDRARKTVLVDYGFRLPCALDNRPLQFEEWETSLNQVIYTSATPGPYERQHSSQIVQQIIRPTGLVDPQVEIRPTKGQVDDLLKEIRARTAVGQRVLVTTLTKRMAEDLADYLQEVGVKVHYLHSEVQTIERIEILRDLRLGLYDVVVGINLLREGLDLPEVSLVAILDADKEGFLRSEQALIQTIGRAARHLDGKAILYGDNVTDSMRRAIEETNRRRTVQEAHNREHGIVPASIVKAVRDLTQRVQVERGAPSPRWSGAPAVAESGPEYRARPTALPKDEAARLIKDLEKQMKAAAQALEFEKAAALRDEIIDLRQALQAQDTRPIWEQLRDA